jgi:hypothetical protein
MYMVQALRVTLTPTLSRKRERGRAERVIGAAEICSALAVKPFSHLREKVARRVR